MNILVEGPDVSGKTTLCIRIIEQLKIDYPDSTIEYIHNSFTNDNLVYEAENKELIGKLTENTGPTGKFIIVDRFYISEVIYGDIIRGKSRVTLYDTVKVNNLFDKIYFSCPDDLDRLTEDYINIKKKRSEYVDDEKIFRRIAEKYKEMGELFKLSHEGEFILYDRYKFNDKQICK